MSIHEKQQKGMVFEYRTGVELPMIDGVGTDDGTGAAWVDIGNRANHPYLENNPYQVITNNDDDDKDSE